VPSDLERHQALAHIMRAILAGDGMEAARTREVLCHHFDRAQVGEAWSAEMRAIQERETKR
jgi:hypothetical protein